MGKKETKIMVQNIDVKLMAEYFSLLLNCSEKDALALVKTAVKDAYSLSDSDEQSVFTFYEATEKKAVASM